MYKILFLVLMPLFSLAQSSVQGKIIDKENSPVANVKITISELNSILYSDENGSFTLIQGNRNLVLILEKDGLFTHSLRSLFIWI